MPPSTSRIRKPSNGNMYRFSFSYRNDRNQQILVATVKVLQRNWSECGKDMNVL